MVCEDKHKPECSYSEMKSYGVLWMEQSRLPFVCEGKNPPQKFILRL